MNNPEEYPYSSYRYYVLGNPDTLITEDFFYSDTGKSAAEKQSRYRHMIIDQIVEESYLKKTWGSDFQRYNEQRKRRYHFK